MNLEETREYFNKNNKPEQFFARPIFNDEFMSRLGELFDKKKFKEFTRLIINDDTEGLRIFF